MEDNETRISESARLEKGTVDENMIFALVDEKEERQEDTGNVMNIAYKDLYKEEIEDDDEELGYLDIADQAFEGFSKASEIL